MIIEKEINYSKLYQNKFESIKNEIHKSGYEVSNNEKLNKYMLECFEEKFNSIINTNADYLGIEMLEGVLINGNPLTQIISFKISNEKMKELINGEGVYYDNIVDNDLELAIEEVYRIFMYRLNDIYGSPCGNIDIESLVIDCWNGGCYPNGIGVEECLDRC